MPCRHWRRHRDADRDAHGGGGRMLQVERDAEHGPLPTRSARREVLRGHDDTIRAGMTALWIERDGRPPPPDPGAARDPERVRRGPDLRARRSVRGRRPRPCRAPARRRAELLHRRGRRVDALLRDLDYEENVADANALRRMLEAVDRCPAPVVAAVQGHALGGGAGSSPARTWRSPRPTRCSASPRSGSGSSLRSSRCSRWRRSGRAGPTLLRHG